MESLGLEQGFRGKSKDRKEQPKQERKGCILLPVTETRRIWASPLSRLKILPAVKDTETAESAKINVNSDAKRRKTGF